MRRRCLLALPVLAIAPCARAQAPGAGRVPPPLPGAQPRNDSGFGTEVLSQMAAREADVQRRLADYPNLRLIRGQVPNRQYDEFLTYMIAAFAKPGWRNAMLAEPGGSKVWTQMDGWTGGKQVIAWVFLLSNRADGGPVPYTIITNMPD